MTEIQTLAEIGTVPLSKLAETVHVTVKDNGNGPRIDARTFVSAGPGETRMVKRGGKWTEAPAYCGWSKVGYWLTIDQAAQLSILLEQAVDAAERITAEDAHRTDWNCPDCGRDNAKESRNCTSCQARKRIGVLA